MLPHGTADEIVELAKMAVEPEYWDEAEGADICSCGERTLLIRAAPEVADAVVAFLAGLEREDARTFTVEVVALPLAREEVIALRAVPGEEALDGERFETRLGESGAHPAVSVATYANTRVAVFGGVQRAWLGGLDALVAEAAHLLDPDVHTAHVGLAVDVAVRPVGRSDRALVELWALPSTRTSTRTVHAGARAALACPTHDVARVFAAATVRLGHWSLAGGTGPETGDGHRYVFVRVTPNPAPDVNAALAGSDLPRIPAREEEEELAVALLPVAGLNTRHHHRSAWGSYLQPSRGGEFSPELCSYGSIGGVEGVVDLVRLLSPDDAWEEPALVEVRNDVLFARNTPRAIAAVEAILDHWRHERIWTLDTTVQVVELPERTATRVGVGGPLPRDRVAVLLEALASGAGRRLAVAKVTSLSGGTNTVENRGRSGDVRPRLRRRRRIEGGGAPAGYGGGTSTASRSRCVPPGPGTDGRCTSASSSSGWRRRGRRGR